MPAAAVFVAVAVVPAVGLVACVVPEPVVFSSECSSLSVSVAAYVAAAPAAAPAPAIPAAAAPRFRPDLSFDEFSPIGLIGLVFIVVRFFNCFYDKFKVDCGLTSNF